jgi:hypothetical protein
MDLSFQAIGALAGLAAFLGLAVLALLYFAQARDLRRLRENASFLLERPEETRAPRPEGAPARVNAGAESTVPQPGESDAEAFRRAELARQAAERRQRFERRRSGGRFGSGNGLRSSLPSPPALAVIVVGALLLIAGVGFGANQFLFEDDDAPSGQAVPKEIEIRVLNSTAEAGAAGRVARQLKTRGFIAKSGNTALPFEVSAVMFEGRNEKAANEIAQAINIKRVEPLIDEIRPDAAGARVVVVIGEDKA